MRLEKTSPQQLIRRLMSPASRFELILMGRCRLDEGWVISRRIIPHHLVYAMESGVMVGKVNGRVLGVRAGGLLWVQPGVEHEFTVPAEAAGSRVMYCRFALGGVNRPLRLSVDWVGCEPDVLARGAMEQLMPEQAVGSMMEPWRRRAVVAALVCRMLGESPNRPQGGGLKPQHRQCALRFIHEHIARMFSLDELADHVGLNTAYFSRAFRMGLGVSPGRYIVQTRVRMAGDLLLETNLSVNAIADRCGYRDVYFFSRQFKQVKGVSPSQWRLGITR